MLATAFCQGRIQQGMPSRECPAGNAQQGCPVCQQQSKQQHKPGVPTIFIMLLLLPLLLCYCYCFATILKKSLLLQVHRCTQQQCVTPHLRLLPSGRTMSYLGFSHFLTSYLHAHVTLSLWGDKLAPVLCPERQQAEKCNGYAWGFDEYNRYTNGLHHGAAAMTQQVMGRP